jgi:hypothetical protein
MHININLWDSPGKQLKVELAQQFENMVHILGMKKYHIDWQVHAEK